MPVRKSETQTFSSLKRQISLFIMECKTALKINQKNIILAKTKNKMPLTKSFDY